MYLSPILEFSRDTLSVAAPTWIDVTSYLLEASWSSGIQKDGEDPQPGQATFVLNNMDRRFEPDYAAGAYYPDIQDMRRFRLRITSSSLTYGEGDWYVTSWQPEWPDQAVANTCTVTCVDGFGVLAQDDLPLLDPPEADSYADVVGFDQPYGYWRLGEPEGTKLVAHPRWGTQWIREQGVVRQGGVYSRRVLYKKRRVKLRPRTTRETRASADGVAGPPGTYRATPTLGVPGAILGDADTAVSFEFANDERAEITIDLEELNVGNRLTVEAWVKPESANAGSGNRYIVHSPDASAGGSVWHLSHVLDSYRFRLQTGVSTVTTLTGPIPAVGTWEYVVATYDGDTARLYVDGVLEASAQIGETVRSATSGVLSIGGRGTGASATFDGVIDEVAVYEKALSAGRILAHYTAATARGWPEQTAGERILDVADHLLWAELGIQVTGLDVQPDMKHGQSRLEVIAELAHSEGPRSLFFFDGNGDPFYLGHEWKAGNVLYNTVQCTLGNQAGEVPYQDVNLIYDNETYNDVTVSHEGGELYQTTDQDSIDARGRRARTEETDVMLINHEDVVFLAEDVLSYYKDPAFRPTTVALDGADTAARLQILTREIGELVRIKHRPKGGTAIDRVTHILGFEKHLQAETGHLTCTWHLARGFNAGLAQWQLGIIGFSELNTTAALG